MARKDRNAVMDVKTVLAESEDPIREVVQATLQQITQQCWDSLEPTIVARPEEWLWPYKHFRYRPRDAARPRRATAVAVDWGSGCRRTLTEAITPSVPNDPQKSLATS